MRNFSVKATRFLQALCAAIFALALSSCGGGGGPVTPVTKIAFTSDRDRNDEVYVMNADGTNPVRLTNNPASDREPAWSPDGRKIAFTSVRDGNEEIYVMNADGTNPVRLTNNPAYDQEPAWSPR